MRIALSISLALLLGWSDSARAEITCRANAPAVVRAALDTLDDEECEAADLTPSSWMFAARYCTFEGRKLLFITLLRPGTPTYMYDGVPAEVWNDFRQASSFGRFFNQRIKGRFDCSRSD